MTNFYTSKITLRDFDSDDYKEFPGSEGIENVSDPKIFRFSVGKYEYIVIADANGLDVLRYDEEYEQATFLCWEARSDANSQNIKKSISKAKRLTPQRIIDATYSTI